MPGVTTDQRHEATHQRHDAGPRRAVGRHRAAGPVRSARGSARSWWQRSLLGRFPGLGALTGATLLSETADQFTQVAMIWVVLVVSHSPADAGLVVLCQRTPEILSGPLLGSRFDRWPPVLLTAIGFVIRGSSIATIAVASQLGSLNVHVVLALCVLMGITNPLAKVGTRVILPMVVPGGDLHVANGVLTIGDQFPYLVGPALGGALAGFAGASSLFVPAVLCLLATVLITRVRIAPRTARARTPTQTRAARGGAARPHPRSTANWFGFRPLLSIPVVRAMMMLTVVYYISYGPLLPAIPVFAHGQLHTGGAGYGAMWSALGLGALAGLILIPRLSRMRPAVLNAMGMVLWGVMLLPLIAVHALVLALVIMFVCGVIWAPYAATEISVIQHWVPSDQHGSVFGARRSVIVASSPAGAALGGLLLERMTAVQVIGLSAAACVVGGVFCLALPSVRKTRPLRGTGPERHSRNPGAGDDPPAASSDRLPTAQ
jgi:MFS family permease